MEGSTTKRPFETHFISENWYPGSASEMMNNHAGQWRVLLPEDYNQTLQQVCFQVDLHESMMCSMLQSTPDDIPISTDAWYVYDGYKAALDPLFELCQSDWYSPNGHVTKFREEVMRDLEDLLIREMNLAWAKETYYGFKSTIPK
ncbi:hypothetical protein BDV93DRAFT_561283 [Ceratobasidium sp. AG-I]|nr:hypothetical protein BDV93DRAFT_561283 [Ceratobasidium sp. AG-I]